MTALASRRIETAESGQGEETTMPLTPEALLNQIQAVDQKHDDAHRRLRESFRDIDGELERLKKTQGEADKLFAAYAATPPDVLKLRFTPSTVVAVVAVCISIFGGFWASTWGLRSSVDALITQMNTQKEVDVAYRKLQDERASSFKDGLDTLRRQQDLQRYEIQSVKDLVNGLKERSR